MYIYIYIYIHVYVHICVWIGRPNLPSSLWENKLLRDPMGCNLRFTKLQAQSRLGFAKKTQHFTGGAPYLAKLAYKSYNYGLCT